jgi:predicted molibdopterin-dependent oxidoreductase YjgC
MADIEFEIDGQTLTAKPNETIIQVADAAGIYIPRFCYHKHLAIAANRKITKSITSLRNACHARHESIYKIAKNDCSTTCRHGIFIN